MSFCKIILTILLVVLSVKCCIIYQENIASCASLHDINTEDTSQWKEFNAENYKNETLTVLETNSFVNIPQLDSIDIRGLINDIEPGAFNNLQQLTIISLYNNDIKVIPRHVFENLTIKYLVLSNSGITTLTKGCFNNNPRLFQILLSNNFIPKITNGVFQNLNIENLLLNSNDIRIIEDDAFENMPNLRLLDLHANKLTTFEPRYVIGKNLALKKLWLYDNHLTSISRNFFEGLPKLEVINLSQNQISTIETNAFQDLKNVFLLEISNNRLESISSQAFPLRGLWNITKLYIHNNQLTYLSTGMLVRLPNLKYIRFGGNPWQCPCLYQLLSWITNNEILYPCDREYFSGLRPVCFVPITNSKDCIYEDNVHRGSVRTYLKELKEYPATKLCGI